MAGNPEMFRSALYAAVRWAPDADTAERLQVIFEELFGSRVPPLPNAQSAES